MLSTYVAARRLKVDRSFRNPGELYPEGHTVRLIEHLLHTGFVKPTLVDEAEFLAAVRRFCPDDETQLCDKLGIAEPIAKTRTSPPSKEIHDDRHAEV